MPAAPSRVAVFAHPDDESWAAGGLLLRLGGVHVVTLTAGEKGVGLGDRRAELAAACGVLGATHEIVGLPDGGLTADAVAAALGPIFRTRQPIEIIGFDRAGGYAHADHVAAVEGTLMALAVLPQRPTVLGAVFPIGLLEPLRDRFVRHNLIDPRFASGPLGAAPDLVIELSPDEANAKRRALECHASQVPRGVDRFLGRGVFAAVAQREGYRYL